jgi:GntR family transcriptional regulator
VTVDHLDPTPLWQQLAAILRGVIQSGELRPRDPLPSESQLQQEHGVSRGTIRRALDSLREEGLVVTIAGRGTFVKPRLARLACDTSQMAYHEGFWMAVVTGRNKHWDVT